MMGLTGQTAESVMISTIVLTFLLATFVHVDSSVTDSGESSVATTTPQPTNIMSAGTNFTSETSTLPYSAPSTAAASLSNLTTTTTESGVTTDDMAGSGEDTVMPGSGATITYISPIEPFPTPSAEMISTSLPLHVTTTEFSATSDQSPPSKTTPSVPDPSTPTPTRKAGNEGLVAGIVVASVVLFVLIIILCVLICCFHMHK